MHSNYNLKHSCLQIFSFTFIRRLRFEGEPGLNGTRGRRGRKGDPGVNGTKGEKGASVSVEDFDWTEILKNCSCTLPFCFVDFFLRDK